MIDYNEIEFVDYLTGKAIGIPFIEVVARYKIMNVPCVNLFIDEKTDRILDAEFDEECRFEVYYEQLYKWGEWSGEETGYNDVLTVGLYSLKYFPEINLYIDIENETVLECWNGSFS